MAKTIKKISNVDLIPAVDGISRKLALRRETCITKNLKKGDNPNNVVAIPGHTYMGVVTKNVNIIGYGTAKSVRLFMRKPMNAPLTTQEQAMQRVHFSRGTAWAREAMMDITVLTANEAKFAAAVNDFSKKIAGVSAAGYQSQYGWMSAVAIALDKDGQLPQTHALPDFDA